MSQPTIADAITLNGTTTEATDLVTAATALASAITAARDAGRFGSAAAGTTATVVHDQLQDELIDLCEQFGANLTA